MANRLLVRRKLSNPSPLANAPTRTPSALLVERLEDFAQSILICAR